MSVHPSWADLRDSHCSHPTIRAEGGTKTNPLYEDFARRRYNYSSREDKSCFRLVFLQEASSLSINKTLRRRGRFIWCHNVKYAGRGPGGYRQISFTIDKGNKTFVVGENNVLCIPSRAFINNNRYFRASDKTFLGFASVFGYAHLLSSMQQNMKIPKKDLLLRLRDDNPLQKGTLVAPRLGYFYPLPSPSSAPPQWDESHPFGIILGPSLDTGDYLGRQLYRVRFGGTTYEKVHPAQMEIINEV